MADDFKYDVFLSHNSKDKPAVENIARLLRDVHNLKAWLDKWNLVPGEAWQDALEDALDESQTFAVFLGPSGIGPWENEEMRSAISDRVQDSSRRVIPVLLPGAPDNKDLDLPRFLKRATWVDFRSGLDDEEALYRLSCGIIGQAPGDRVSFISPKTATKADWHLAHPYPMQPNFVGRVVEQKILDDWLTDDKDRLFILRALGGFGKSALAWQWINMHVNPKEWPKLVWWSFYEGDASFEHFVEETLKYLKLEIPQGQRPQLDELLKAMQGEKILLIIDGFERALRAYSSMNAVYQGDAEPKLEDNQLDCVNFNAEIFLKSVCSLLSIKSKVLMTTRLIPRCLKRRGEFMLSCREEELTAMQKEDAVEFFHKQKIKGARTEIEAACEPYGYHPLSLRILSGLIINDRERPGDIQVAEKLDITANIIQNKDHVLSVAYNSLSFGQQKLLSNMACFRSSIEYEALKSITSKPSWKRKNKNLLSEELDDGLSTLESRGLMNWNRSTNKYNLHPIVRRYAYQRLIGPELIIAHKRLRDYFATVDVPSEPQNVDELSPLIERYHHTIRAEQYQEAMELYLDRISDWVYYRFGSYQTAIELLRALFSQGEEHPPQIRDERQQGWVLSALANSYGEIGQPKQALEIYQRGYDVNKKRDNSYNVGIRLGAIVMVAYLPLGMFKLAEENLNRLIELGYAKEDKFNEARGHLMLGLLCAYKSDYDEAMTELGKAIELFEHEGNIQSAGLAWGHRAICAFLMNDVNLMFTAAKKARGMADDQKYERDIIMAEWLLGTSYRLSGKYELADQHLTGALTRDHLINYVRDEANILLALARLRYDQKNYAEAKSLTEEALSITERYGYVLQGADVSLFLAQYALEQEKDKAKAKEYAESALKLAYCDGPPYYYKVAYEEAERFLEKLK